MKRGLLALSFAALLLATFLRLEGQAVLPHSRPEHENLTFFVNHSGLEQLEVDGEVGFGDLVRILMRRRSNAPSLQRIRDRFTYASTDAGLIDTPDLFKIRITESGIEWVQRPERFVVAAGRTFNLAFVVENTRPDPAEFRVDRAPKTSVAPHSRSAYIARITNPQSTAVIEARSGKDSIRASVGFDVRPLARLRVRIADGPARVYLTGADGLAYAPRGTCARIATIPAEYYFHTRGEFEIDVPSGKTRIEATRGQEYELTSTEIDLQPPGTTVTVPLTRWMNAATSGWYSGDAHIHANYWATHHQSIDPEDVQLQIQAEDLNVANLVVGNSSGSFLHDEQFFEGKLNRLSAPNHLIYWNEEFRNQGMYGHMTFWNLKTFVDPPYTGFAGTKYWEDFPANAIVAEKARAQGGAVTYAHPVFGPGLYIISAREFPVDAALGAIDAFDVLSNLDEPGAMEFWYHVLNSGFRVAASAGTDAFTNITDHYVAGGGRVYVHTTRPLRYEQWIRDYKAGHSFVSNGPILLMTVNGQQPGTSLNLATKATVNVRASVTSNVPLDSFEIVVNGKVVKSTQSRDLSETVQIVRSSWIAVRASGPQHRLVPNDAKAFAHTSPVYVSIADKPAAVRESLDFCIDKIQRLIDRTMKEGRFATAERRDEVTAVFKRGLAIYEGRRAKIEP